MQSKASDQANETNQRNTYTRYGSLGILPAAMTKKPPKPMPSKTPNLPNFLGAVRSNWQQVADANALIELRTSAALGAMKSAPKRHITAKNILERDTLVGWTVIHILADINSINDLPAEFITEENFNMQTYDGKTVFHLLHDYSCLPQNFFTAEQFTRQDKEGNTPLHRAAKLGKLHQIPKALLTRENLS